MYTVVNETTGRKVSIPTATLDEALKLDREYCDKFEGYVPTRIVKS